MLIDEYLPQYDAVERHATVVCNSAARVYAALRTADLAAFPLVRLLLALRTLPEVLRDGGSGVRHLRRRLATPSTLHAFAEQEFVILAEDPAAGTAHRPSGHRLDVAGWGAARRCAHLSRAAARDSPGGLELHHRGGGRRSLSPGHRNACAVCRCGQSPSLLALLVGDSPWQQPHPAWHAASDAARGGARHHLSKASRDRGVTMLFALLATSWAGLCAGAAMSITAVEHPTPASTWRDNPTEHGAGGDGP
jgi:hypothetical protein